MRLILGKKGGLLRRSGEGPSRVFRRNVSPERTLQSGDCHLVDMARALRPFVVRKAFQRLPNSVDQASFAGLAEADANRTIKADLFHGLVERRSRPNVPHMKPITPSGLFQQHAGLAGGLDEFRPGIVAGTQAVGRLNASHTSPKVDSTLVRPTGIPQQFRGLLHSGDADYQSDFAKSDRHWRREKLHFHEPLNSRLSRQFPYIHGDQDAGFLRRVPESKPRLVGRGFTPQGFDQLHCGALARRSMHRPIIGHQDFCGLLNGGDIPDDASMQDFHRRPEPSSAGTGHA
jgi:hypothetical protein